MFFKRDLSMPYLILIDILVFNSNVWLVMSQGLSRYDKKGEILLVYYFLDYVTQYPKRKLDKLMSYRLFAHIFLRC